MPGSMLLTALLYCPALGRRRHRGSEGRHDCVTHAHERPLWRLRDCDSGMAPSQQLSLGVNHLTVQTVTEGPDFLVVTGVMGGHGLKLSAQPPCGLRTC